MTDINSMPIVDPARDPDRICQDYPTHRRRQLLDILEGDADPASILEEAIANDQGELMKLAAAVLRNDWAAIFDNSRAVGQNIIDRAVELEKRENGYDH